MDFIMQVTNKWKTFSRKINKHFSQKPISVMPWVNRYSALRRWGYKDDTSKKRGKYK